MQRNATLEIGGQKARPVPARATPNVHVELTVKLAELANAVEPHARKHAYG